MRRTGPLSWLLSHIYGAAWELWRDLVDIVNCFRHPALPPRQPPAWLSALPVYHPDRSGPLTPAQEQEWAVITEHLGPIPAVPEPRRETP